MKLLKTLVLIAVLASLTTCKKDQNKTTPDINNLPYEVVKVPVNISLPISNNETDSLVVNTLSWEGHPVNKGFTCGLKQNSYNVISLLKNGKLYGIVRVNPGNGQSISITPELIAKSIVAQISDFIDPGYGSIDNAINNAQKLPHFQDLVNLLNTKWGLNGISDLLTDQEFTYTIKQLTLDLIPSKKKKDLLKENRIVSVKSGNNDNIIEGHITFPSIKDPGLNITEGIPQNSIFPLTFENIKRRQADIYIYKNNVLTGPPITLGGKVQYNYLTEALTDLIYPSKRTISLDFSNMNFSDSYRVTILGPGWSMPLLLDDRYGCISCPYPRTLFLNNGLPILFCVIDFYTAGSTGTAGTVLNLSQWLDNTAEWANLMEQLKNGDTGTVEYFVDAFQAVSNTVANLLSDPVVVNNLGKSVFNYSGENLNTWSNAVRERAGILSGFLSIIGMVVEETFAITDYVFTGYRTDYYFIKIDNSAGYGDLQGGWQGFGSNNQDCWQNIYVFSHSSSTNFQYHAWEFGCNSGFIEVKGDGTYNPQTLTGTWYDRDFVQYLPAEGWCWSRDIDNFTLNPGLNVINSNTYPQAGEPCQETPGNLILDKNK